MTDDYNITRDVVFGVDQDTDPVTEPCSRDGHPCCRGPICGGDKCCADSDNREQDAGASDGRGTFSLTKFLMSRKFVLALLMAAFASVALGLGWLTGGEWVAAASIILSLYGASNILQPKFEKDPTDQLEA